MYELTRDWIRIDDLGPMNYYLYDGDDYGGGILEHARVVPPLSDDKVLREVKSNWLHMADHNKRVYNYKSTQATCYGEPQECSDITLYRYYPTIFFGNYYVYENRESQHLNPDREPIETHEFVVFIKSMGWEETLSEGCGWMTPQYSCEIYLGRTLDDIVNYGLLSQDKHMFQIKKNE